MKNELDILVSNLKLNKNREAINNLIEDYKPFIINTISSLKNEYIQLENDEEYSIGLMAFAEAIDKYEIHKGSFLNFAALVIVSRVKTFLSKKKNNEYYSLDELNEVVIDKSSSVEEAILRDEIQAFEKELLRFNIEFDDLIDSSPKHKDTRAKAVEIGVKTSDEEDLVSHLYQKRRLPVTKIARRFFISVKIIKRSKLFITAIVVVIKSGYSSILSWIKD